MEDFEERAGGCDRNRSTERPTRGNFLQVRARMLGDAKLRNGVRLTNGPGLRQKRASSTFVEGTEPSGPRPDDLRSAVNHKPEKSRAPTEVNEPPGSATMRKWVGSHNSRPEE
ncbi:hypothetical protein K0M31_013546 [Melipona bicolor]|uniref:Uncharacterized protein n=1 Tax=Melipona bicolor TaxID=60889 RepID=A0AA40KGH0_9HYME|nr:hypothetical protein K0M31_013546 [Melipona bicolor]